MVVSIRRKSWAPDCARHRQREREDQRRRPRRARERGVAAPCRRRRGHSCHGFSLFCRRGRIIAPCESASPPIVAFGSAGRPTNPARSLHRSTAQTPSPPIVAFGSAGRPTNPARSLHVLRRRLLAGRRGFPAPNRGRRATLSAGGFPQPDAPCARRGEQLSTPPVRDGREERPARAGGAAPRSRCPARSAGVPCARQGGAAVVRGATTRREGAPCAQGGSRAARAAADACTGRARSTRDPRRDPSVVPSTCGRR